MQNGLFPVFPRGGLRVLWCSSKRVWCAWRDGDPFTTAHGHAKRAPPDAPPIWSRNQPTCGGSCSHAGSTCNSAEAPVVASVVLTFTRRCDGPRKTFGRCWWIFWWVFWWLSPLPRESFGSPFTAFSRLFERLMGLLVRPSWPSAPVMRQNGRSQGQQASGLSPLSEPPSCRARLPCTIHPSLTQRAS